jgi:hypothetical protein
VIFHTTLSRTVIVEIWPLPVPTLLLDNAEKFVQPKDVFAPSTERIAPRTNRNRFIELLRLIDKASRLRCQRVWKGPQSAINPGSTLNVATWSCNPL